MKVTAYDFSIYGGLEGRVVQVSADSIYDEKEKQAYFTVIVETDKSLPDGARPPLADHAGHDDRHADHHRAQEHPDLSAEAGAEGEKRRAPRALIGCRRRRGGAAIGRDFIGAGRMR